MVAVSFPTVQRYQNSQQLGRQTGIYEIILLKEQQLALQLSATILAGEESESVVGSLHLSPQSAIPNREGGRSSDGEINNGEADDGGGKRPSVSQVVHSKASKSRRRVHMQVGPAHQPQQTFFCEKVMHFIKQVPTCQSA